MLDIFAQYATDPKAELEGKEFDFGGGVTLLIARAHNTKFTRLLSKLQEVHKHTLEQKDTPEAEDRSNKILAEVMSKSVLLGWTGPMMFKKQPLPYTIENAQMLLNIKEFQNEVWRKAIDFKNFRYEVEAADEKNLPTTTDGTLPGEASSTTSLS